MARTRIVAGPNGQETIALTPEEEIARDAEELAWTNARPMEDWKEVMLASDSDMPRWGEDILDTMSNKSSVPQITLDKLQAKKDLRATKP